jgi:hypothetical protein
MIVEDYGVPGIVPAGIPGDVVKRGSEKVNDFTFSFISPLRADYHHCFCRGFVHPPRYSQSSQAAQSPAKIVPESLQEGRCGKDRKKMVRPARLQRKPMSRNDAEQVDDSQGAVNVGYRIMCGGSNSGRGH